MHMLPFEDMAFVIHMAIVWAPKYKLYNRCGQFDLFGDTWLNPTEVLSLGDKLNIGVILISTNQVS